MTGKPITVVTGGAGFIGSHMVDNLLAHGCRVRAVDNLVSGRESNIAHLRGNPDFSFEQADIRRDEVARFEEHDIPWYKPGGGDGLTVAIAQHLRIRGSKFF